MKREEKRESEKLPQFVKEDNAVAVHKTRETTASKLKCGERGEALTRYAYRIQLRREEVAQKAAAFKRKKKRIGSTYNIALLLGHNGGCTQI